MVRHSLDGVACKHAYASTVAKRRHSVESRLSGCHPTAGPAGQHWAAPFSTQEPADGLAASLDAPPLPVEEAPAPEQQDGAAATASTSNRAPAVGGHAYGPRLVQAAQHGPAKPRPQEGIIHIHNTRNNCHLVLTDREGNVKTWTSSGSAGFKNSGKSTPMAAEAAAAEIARRAVAKGFVSVVVKLKGTGRAKSYALTSLAANGLTVKQLQDITPIPYNGCRLPRKRRT